MKLYLLQLGLRQPLRVPVLGYLFQSDDGGNVLVDTGDGLEFQLRTPWVANDPQRYEYVVDSNFWKGIDY